MAEPRFRTLDEFWPFYLSQHMRPGTRRLHVLGTTLGLAFLAAALAWACPWFLLAGLVSAYGSAWVGHFFIEKNAPATFRYPLLSFRADLRMYRLALLGRLDAEISREADRIRRHLT